MIKNAGKTNDSEPNQNEPKLKDIENTNNLVMSFDCNNNNEKKKDMSPSFSEATSVNNVEFVCVVQLKMIIQTLNLTFVMFIYGLGAIKI